MNKYDEILNELVYEIDDIVYDFYSQSNALIAHKKGQDRLIEYRDQSLDTVNEMNVRSLEIISDIKKRDLVQERAAKLLDKNRQLVASILEVIEAAPNKSEFMEDLSGFVSNALDGAKQVVKNVEASEGFDKVKDITAQSIDKAKETIDNISHDERFIKGKEVIKDKTKEAVEFSSQVIKDGSKKLADWLDERSQKEQEETYDDVSLDEESLDGE